MSPNDIRKHSLAKQTKQAEAERFSLNIHSEFPLWTIIFRVFLQRGREAASTASH
jgi:hypothetical protein